MTITSGKKISDEDMRSIAKQRFKRIPLWYGGAILATIFCIIEKMNGGTRSSVLFWIAFLMYSGAETRVFFRNYLNRIGKLDQIQEAPNFPIINSFVVLIIVLCLLIFLVPFYLNR